MAALDGRSLHDALALLQRLQAGGGVRELVALSIRIDGWLPADAEIRLPDGGVWPELGYRLRWPGGAGERWLLPGAQMMELPGSASQGGPQVVALAELEEEATELAVALRRAVLDAYLAEKSLELQDGLELQKGLAEILGLARSSDPLSRAHLLRALHTMMADRRDHWGPIAAHLRSGFESALADREEGGYRTAVAALVELALFGPFPPPTAGDPRRIIDVLFRVPRPEIRAATLRELSRLPADVLESISEQLAPHARDALTHQDPNVRLAAGELELQLATLSEGDAGDGRAAAAREDVNHSGLPIKPIIDDLDSMAAYRRARALRQIGDRARDLPALLPRLLEALEDEDVEVRSVAVRAVEPLLEARSEAVRERTLAALIRAFDPLVVHAGLEAIGRPPFDVDESLAERLLREALDGPEDSREAAAVRLSALFVDRPPPEAAQGYGGLLRHMDPLVRLVALRSLGRDAADRPLVRDALTHDLMARLEDPEPALRVAAVRTLAAMGHPGAADISARLAGDPDPIVRQGSLEVLRRIGKPSVVERGEQIGRDVGALFDLAHDGGGDARMRWSRALADLAAQSPPQLPQLLVGLLKRVPPDTPEPFLRFVVEEVDRELLHVAERSPGGLAGLCRRLVEPPDPRPEHAARLAATGAASDPQLFDLLWTMATVGSGAASESARRALSGLSGQPASNAVRAAARAAWASADNSERDVLRTLLGRLSR